ncbi:sigma-70 family RNA polymerase sigma factor [Candidatus Poribacteria bacterium]|nr:sigma-70 family RNA polymerase sigma factor [Candidatus Poribacteria bacterium]
MKHNDVKLINQILAGDETAFVSLVEKYQKQVHALAWRKIGDFHIAEEITQDTFLKVYQKLSTLRDPKQFSGWLYVIANRQCIAWLRKKRIETESIEDTDTEWIDDTAYSRYVAEERANDTVETQREVVKKLLAKLKESERTVMTLHYLGEMTTEEISRFLGVSTSAIKLRLHRARQRLQKEETMIREALSNFKLSPYLTDNIIEKVRHIKPTAPSGSKPFTPWVIGASSFALIVLMFGIGSRYLARFQMPYSFDTTAEIKVDIIDAPVVANLESEPDVRTQLGSVNALDKRNNPEQQPNNASAAITEAQGEEIVEDYTKWGLPKEAKARFGKGGINMLQFSPDGRQLAVGSDIGLWLYDTKTGKEVSMFPGKYESIAFSPDGRFLSGSIGSFRRKGSRFYAMGLQLWEVATGQKRQLTRFLPNASVLRFSADGKTLFALGYKGDTFSQLDVATGKGMWKRIEGQIHPGIFVDPGCYALTHDKFAIGVGTKIELWDTTTDKILFTLEGNISLLALEFSPDGTRLASAGKNNNENEIVPLQLWDINSKESILLDKHTGWINALAFSSDGKMLASGGKDKTVQLWDTATGEPITTFTGHTRGINDLTFSQDNRTLVSGSADGTVRFWNIKNGNLLPTHITGHTMEVETATFFKDNTMLASVAYDQVISIWDVKTSRKTGSNALQKIDFYPENHEEWRYLMASTSAFSPDGTKFASSGVNVIKGNKAFPLVSLSDVRTGRELQTLAAKEGYASPVTFSPDGKTVAFGTSGEICIWNTETGDTSDISLPDISLSYQNVKRKRKFKSTISTLVFSPDGKKLVSGTKDGKVQMWDAKTGVPLTLLYRGEEPVLRV